ncbi:putative U-box domain-containing protein 50 isoform X2 [Telopea speciosissima]|nr:putative U-box domain-containing protein 50 isoform X2 [Telopea speciosissima]
MDNQMEKIYIAVGNDLNEGLGTLEWALRKWSGQTISFVIVHVDNTCRDFVNTPFGKLPASSVSEEKLEIIRMLEQDKIDKLLSKFKASCGKVKTEVLKIKKSEEPIHKEIVEFISNHQVTKLVMGITVVKSSSWKTKTAISASFYIHRNKPSFCEVYIICGGKSVFLREENVEGYMENERGTMVSKMKEKGSMIGWLGKMFIDNTAKHETQGRVYPRGLSPAREVIDTEPVGSRDWWEDYGAPQVESYLQWLSSSKMVEEQEEEEDEEEEYSGTRYGLTELANVEHISHDHITDASCRIEILKAKIQEAQKIIEEKRKEAKEYVERQQGAQHIISLCNRRGVELEARINVEVDKNQVELKNKLEAARENIYEVSSDIEESKNRLRSLLELQSELAAKLHSSSLAKSQVEAQLENAMATKIEILREMDELRRQRELLRRRIEFCKKREAITAANRSSSSLSEPDQLNYSYREFTADEIRLVTANFSEHMRLKKISDQTSSYRGRLNHMAVALELHASLTSLSVEEFRAKMELLSQIQHPHLLKIIGACPELRCIISQYMRNGCLYNFLFSTQRNPNCYQWNNNKSLYWHARIRIAAEVCMGLGFLHSFEPRPILHGEVNLFNVLLDRNLVAIITVSQLSECLDESELRSEICDFGVVMLQLLTGREGDDEIVEEVIMAMEGDALHGILDAMAGDWPMDLAMEFTRIALRCVDINGNMELTTTTVMEEVEEVRRKAAELMEKEGSGHREEDQNQSDVPYIFLCPILQEVMKNPHVAADGFSYELRAIEEWLGSGHETSPMTNLRLEHKFLTPNQTLRSLIQEWLNNRPIAP